MGDNYKHFPQTPDSLARSGSVVVPSDTVDLPNVSRLFIGTEGDINVILADDSSAIVFKNISGFPPLLVKRVLASNTTATDIRAL